MRNSKETPDLRHQHHSDIHQRTGAGRPAFDNPQPSWRDIKQPYKFCLEYSLWRIKEDQREQRPERLCRREQPLLCWHLQHAGHLHRGPGNEKNNANHCHGGLTGVDEWPPQPLNTVRSACRTMFLSGHARSTSLHQPRLFPVHTQCKMCTASCQFRKSWFISQPH